ncbi:MAG: acyl-[ACP]--phospholipid O-acyltransferase [Cardiobacteriaceae bacterium]|nr:acyl-[ACP]--phospholipid O-acyltransferase [Cardiobacteriaceae bacterium]
MNIWQKRGFLSYLMIAFLNASVDLGHKITIQNILLKSYSGDSLVILTALINAMILLPFIFLFSPSGWINDRYAQTKVVRYSALLAIGITFAIYLCYLLGAFQSAFLLTLILAAQSAIYSPAKYSMIKLLVGVEQLGKANGIIQALTIVAILLSSFAYSFVFEQSYSGATDPKALLQSVHYIGLSLVILSALEAFFAYQLPEVGRENQDIEHFSLQKYASLRYLRENLRVVHENRNIWLSIIGLSVFWGISQIVVAVFPAHYKALLGNSNALMIQAILALSAIGIMFGSTLSGALSKYHIEHGTVPVGAVGLFVSLLGMASSQSALGMGISSFAFGFSGGLLVVPLNATIQFFAQDHESGKIMAGNNFIQNIAMVGFLVLSIVLTIKSFSTTAILILSALVCLIASFYAIGQLPHLFARILLLPILKAQYRFNVMGLNQLPQTGGVLLLGNHISWIDWLVLQVASPRAIKFVMYRGIYQKWYLRWFLKIFKVIPIGMGNSQEALAEIRETLKRGEVVALFPEGMISYNGQINVFQRGYESALADLDEVCIVPFYLRGLWGSSFSRADGFYKNLTRSRGKRDILVAFGEPIHEVLPPAEMRQKVVELSQSAWEDYIQRQKPITHHYLDTAKRNLFQSALSDAQGTDLNQISLLTAVLLFAKKIRHLGGKGTKIGVMLPNSAGASIVNWALMFNGQIPIHLNYTLNQATLEKALLKANIQTVITSELFLEKLQQKGIILNDLIAPKALFAEELKTSIKSHQKILTFLEALLMPRFWLKWRYLAKSALNDTAVILFSSGSEGEPKGVELSHANLLTNIRQMSDLLNFKKDDVILNSLPIFHSFGLTVTTLLPLCEGIKMVCLPDPTDALTVGKMVARHRVSILFGTSTFFRLYSKNPKLLPLMFQSVRMAIAGAEKLNPEVREAFRLKFGLEIYEGYGTTETTPVACVNMPNMLEREHFKELQFNQTGSVGLPLPATVIRIVEPETYKALPQGEAGLILIGGGQVMKGYLNDPERTAQVIVELDGKRFYQTGDKGYLDKNGFLVIVDRYSRFAKIGGEMISLGAVEEAIRPLLAVDTPVVAVNLPDEKKGEKVVLLVQSLESPESFKALLQNSGLNPLMMPSQIFTVENIPVLGSGKTDYAGAKQLALKQR